MVKVHPRNNNSNHTRLSPLEWLRGLSAGVRWTGIGLLLLLVTFITWFSLEAYQAKSNLELARTSAEQSKDALLGGNPQDAARSAENAQMQARLAQTATYSLPWKVAAVIPILGSPMKTTQQISDVVVALTDDILLPTATMGAAISLDRLIDGTRIDLKLLSEEQPRLSELSAAAARLDAQAQAIKKPAYLSLISDARSQLQDQTSKLAQLLGNTSIAAQLAPSMMGASGPRTYLMAFQTNAEARGTGGLLGGFGVLRFDNGTPTVDALAPNSDLEGASASINLGPEFNGVYGWMNPYDDSRNSNLSPHFPYAAQIWRSMWERRSGTTVDGVIALDPIALSYVLGAVGPVKLPDGELITQENVVELTLSRNYFRFPTDRVARKKYLQDIAEAVVKRMTQPLPAPRQLLDALGKAANEGRIAVWSASPADQELLEKTPLAHVIPEDAAPYAQVIINNLGGNKMDYYLKRDIEYAADGCDGDMRNSTITVRLANSAGDGPLPDYVSGLTGLPGFPIKAPDGSMVTSVRVIATNGSKLMSVTSNGERIRAITHTERGHPSFEIQLVIPPGQIAELSFRLSEPTVPGPPRVPVQPLVDAVTPTVSVPECSR